LTIPEYQMVPILIQVLTGNFLLLELLLHCSTNQRSIPFGYFFHLMVLASSGPSSVFSGDFIAEEMKRVEDEVSGDATMVDVQTSWRPF